MSANNEWGTQLKIVLRRGSGIMDLQKIPEMTWETIKRMEDFTWFDHAKIFDDLLIVTQRETSCFVWKTKDGLVVIDGI